MARVQFPLQEAGETVIRLYDITGRIIAQTRNLLYVGQHTYTAQGIKEGLYVIKINSGGLKEAGTEHWQYPNTQATNETGFTALPWSSRNNTYNFQSIGHYGTWW